MDQIETAINFFNCTIFIALGFFIVATMILGLNNLFSKYWKKITWLKFEPYYVKVDEDNS